MLILKFAFLFPYRLETLEVVVSNFSIAMGLFLFKAMLTNSIASVSIIFVFDLMFYYKYQSLKKKEETSCPLALLSEIAKWSTLQSIPMIPSVFEKLIYSFSSSFTIHLKI